MNTISGGFPGAAGRPDRPVSQEPVDQQPIGQEMHGEHQLVALRRPFAHSSVSRRRSEPRCPHGRGRAPVRPRARARNRDRPDPPWSISTVPEPDDRLTSSPASGWPPRQAMRTCPPRFARSIATAFPSPLLAPVTRHTLPSMRTLPGTGRNISLCVKRSTIAFNSALRIRLRFAVITGSPAQLPVAPAGAPRPQFAAPIPSLSTPSRGLIGYPVLAPVGVAALVDGFVVETKAGRANRRACRGDSSRSAVTPLSRHSPFRW